MRNTDLDPTYPDRRPTTGDVLHRNAVTDNLEQRDAVGQDGRNGGRRYDQVLHRDIDGFLLENFRAREICLTAAAVRWWDTQLARSVDQHADFVFRRFYGYAEQLHMLRLRDGD